MTPELGHHRPLNCHYIHALCLLTGLPANKVSVPLIHSSREKQVIATCVFIGSKSYLVDFFMSLFCALLVIFHMFKFHGSREPKKFFQP